MTEQEIFAAKAKEGYTVCYAEQCAKKEQCMRWEGGSADV